ncbi:hypothetical protein ACU4GD_28380 [Cupriavidus basilensis]
MILFSYYARTCDPAVEYLQLYSKLGTDDRRRTHAEGVLRGNAQSLVGGHGTRA